MSTTTSAPVPTIVDRHLVEVAGKCDHAPARPARAATPGTDAWWRWAREVVAVASESGRIGWELAETLLDLAYEVHARRVMERTNRARPARFV